jgi:ATP/maltotriose-dependent transcriptional regulator MalT
MLNLGIALGKAGKAEEEIASHRDLITRFGESTRPELQEQVARATLNLGIVLGRAGKAEEANSVYRDLITNFGEKETESIRATVAPGLLFRGRYLLASGQAAEAVEFATRAGGMINSLPPRLGWELAVPVQILLSDSLHASGRKSESRLALKSAASRLASMSTVTLSQVDDLLKAALGRLPLPDVRQLLGELSHHANPEVSDMARLHRFVLDVLEAQEAPRGRTKLNPSTRKRRALARVPAELRAVVAEKADIVRKERRKG